MIKKKLMTFSLLIATVLSAETFTMVVPQKPGDGTSIWTEIVAKELAKYLPGDTVKIRYIPGGRDIPGFNKWAEELRTDPTMMMVSHGGNAVSFLEEKVSYNYKDYDSIGMMNLNIIVGKRKDADMNKIAFASGSGMEPDAMAITMMLCGPNKTVDEYGQCFEEKVVWVKGMSGGERRIGYLRGELTATRETPAAYKKHFEPLPENQLWFHHGILQPNGKHTDDPNYKGYQFENLFKAKYGVYPKGEFYDSYKLVKSFRDALQKAIWVNKGNPNTEKLRKALRQVAANPASVAEIEKDVGKYQWVLGNDGNKVVDTVSKFITEKSLRNLVKFNKDHLDLAAIYKPELVK